MANDNEQFDKFSKKIQEAAKFQEKLTSSVGDYINAIKEVGVLQDSIKHSSEQLLKLNQEITALKEEEIAIETKLSGKLTDKKRRELEANLSKVKQHIRVQTKLVGVLNEQLETTKKQTKEYVEQVKEVNKINLGFNTIVKGASKIPGLLDRGFGKLKGSGIFEIDKEIRLAGKSLNITNKNFSGFENNILKAANTTGQWGVNAKDLAKAQQSYSDEIGRSIILGDEALISIGRIAKGTNLGVEGAASMVAEMDKFGLSVKASTDLVEETIKTAAKMGVNSNKSVKSLQNYLKLAQRYTFKGGVKALTTMANESARLKLDMDGISGLAEKVFRPEGAVEMAAKLQVMGGEFSKLGDPMTLMFKARNDFAGFAKDIGKATAEFVDFNGEIKGGLAADRMREIANITGISVEKLQEMGQVQSRLNEFGSKISADIVDEKDRELIASLAEKKDGKITVKLGNNDPLNINELTKENLRQFKEQEITLAKRAKQAETFDEVFNNFVYELKSSMVPIANELKNGLGNTLIDLMKTWNNEKFYEKLRNFAEIGGKLVSSLLSNVAEPIGKFVGKFPELSAALYLLFGPAKWYANGVMLRKGFNALGGFGNTPNGGNINTPNSKGTKTKNSGKFGKIGTKKNGMSFGKSLGKGLKGFSGLGLLSMGTDYGRGFLDNKDSDFGKSLGIAGSAAEYAAYGALLGSIIPGIGNVAGGIAGGLLGGAFGIYDEYFKENKGKVSPMMPIPINDGIIQFNKNDKFMPIGRDAMIAGTNVNGNKDLAKAITNDNSSEMKHKFDDLNINISFNSDSSWLNRIGDDIANDRKFIRELTIKIQEEIRMAIGGGKLNPNPY